MSGGSGGWGSWRPWLPLALLAPPPCVLAEGQTKTNPRGHQPPPAGPAPVSPVTVHLHTRRLGEPSVAHTHTHTRSRRALSHTHTQSEGSRTCTLARTPGADKSAFPPYQAEHRTCCQLPRLPHQIRLAPESKGPRLHRHGNGETDSSPTPAFRGEGSGVFLGRVRQMEGAQDTPSSLS